MIKLAICDDMYYYVEELKEIIISYDWKDEYEIYEFTTAEKLIKSVRDGQEYNILLMDILLKDRDSELLGTEVASRIKNMYPNMLIIYISSYDCYYEDMVQAEPFAFITKPVTLKKLSPVIDSALMRLKVYNYSYTFNNETYIINLRDVLYFYSEHRKVYIKKKDNTEESFYSKLDDVQTELESMCPFFARANKSYLININFVKITNSNSIMINNERISLSRKLKEKFLIKTIKNR